MRTIAVIFLITLLRSNMMGLSAAVLNMDQEYAIATAHWPASKILIIKIYHSILADSVRLEVNSYEVLMVSKISCTK
ncbi:hypothetical protein [Dyadobacter sp. CY312]|uniref:hypothetical protein n=1 Tax=Dyadobacter sp. CY312 TaxID=2907303 RepID=UPI001F47182A|nr:hypothetical protein [Dyadobacter sp. CY312]MCE7042812.1 hypothetical protein [Dyadobacter sp. CY312]